LAAISLKASHIPLRTFMAAHLLFPIYPPVFYFFSKGATHKDQGPKIFVSQNYLFGLTNITPKDNPLFFVNL